MAWVLSPYLFEVQGQKKSLVLHYNRLQLCEDRVITFWVRRKRHQLFEQEERDPVVENVSQGEESDGACGDEQLGTWSATIWAWISLAARFLQLGDATVPVAKIGRERWYLWEKGFCHQAIQSFCGQHRDCRSQWTWRCLLSLLIACQHY